MKTLDQLTAKIATMSREQLAELAENIVTSMYASIVVGTPNFIQLSQGNEWRIDTLESVAEDIEEAGLNPDSL